MFLLVLINTKPEKTSFIFNDLETTKQTHTEHLSVEPLSSDIIGNVK